MRQPPDLVEREDVLQRLRAALATAARQGQLALVAGEAGIGKTSLLRTLAREQAGAGGTVWWGGCDALETPQPLAPLLDIARDARPPWAGLLDGPRPALFDGLLAALRGAPAPVLLVVEDVHWADDATLDLLKYLGRRIEPCRALLVLSYRDDEVDARHPLRRVIGELPAAALTRVSLHRLSAAAVQTLAGRAGRDAAELHRISGGNPFFVAELLRDDAERPVPASVRDLVLARFARLPEPVQALLRLVAVVPGPTERWLVEALLAPAEADLEAALASGLLVSDGATLVYRHELGRVAVESALPAPLAQALHARVLAALVARGDAAAARRVHHALGAGDTPAISRFAVEAAAQAGQRGAHREAAAHWLTALRHGRPADNAERAAWLEAYAAECQLTDQLDAALAARAELAPLLQARPAAAALNLGRTALLQVLALRNAEAEASCARALALLDGLPPSREQAFAWWVDAQLRMLGRDCAASAVSARRAHGLAVDTGQAETAAAALGTLGAATIFSDYSAGCALLEQALQQALAQGLDWVAANSYANLGSGSGELMQFDAAERWLDAAVRFATEREIDFYRHYAMAWQSLCHLARGRWDEAARLAGEVVARAGVRTTSRVMALVALGRLRLRRGDPGVAEALDEALALAQASGTLQRLAPVHAARAEAALARGDAATARAEALAVLPLAQARGHPIFQAELLHAAWCAGRVDLPALPAGTPFALEVTGRWREAAEAWRALACPFDEARALAAGDTEAQRQALVAFERLGARPAAEALRARLQQAGVRGLARGPRASTQLHPAGLTAAEQRVLALLARGLRNADIAAQLHRSVRTVDHQVAAVLAKLGAGSRAEAVEQARRAGWLDTR